MDDLTTNIVQVRLIEDANSKRYTYHVPDNVYLVEGDFDRVRNKDGEEHIAICATDSEYLSENAIDMIMCGKKIISNVIGIYKLKLL